MSESLANSVIEQYATHPRVTILMSGVGTNARTILESTEIRDYYTIDCIASDNTHSNAQLLADEHGLDAIVHHVGKFANMEQRHQYFDDLAKILSLRGVTCVFYAGFMKVTTSEFCARFPGINVHPADLSIKDDDGVPKYRGMNALNLMCDDLGFVRCTVHVTDTPVDTGSALTISDAVFHRDGQTYAELHQELKMQEHFIYPETLKILGRGEISFNDIPVMLSRGAADA
jgi:folate-dependent phosphoribosylglycinamide formyltransferase PurN